MVRQLTKNKTVGNKTSLGSGNCNIIITNIYREPIVWQVLCMHAKLLPSCPTLCNPARFLCPWDCPDKNTGVGCYTLLQGIFLTRLLNLLCCRWILYCWATKEAPAGKTLSPLLPLLDNKFYLDYCDSLVCLLPLLPFNSLVFLRVDTVIFSKE